MRMSALGAAVSSQRSVTLNIIVRAAEPKLS